MDPATGATPSGAPVCPRGHAVPDGSRFCPRCGERLGASAPTWATVREALAVVAHPPNLRKTLLTAVVVGFILFAINQMDVVLTGDATASTWVKAALTFVVPFAVSNVGILIATHRRPPG